MQAGTRCSECGAEFTCGAADPEPCWCASMPPLPVVTPGQACLCRDCLAKKIQSERSLAAG